MGWTGFAAPSSDVASEDGAGVMALLAAGAVVMSLSPSLRYLEKRSVEKKREYKDGTVDVRELVTIALLL